MEIFYYFARMKHLQSDENCRNELNKSQAELQHCIQQILTLKKNIYFKQCKTNNTKGFEDKNKFTKIRVISGYQIFLQRIKIRFLGIYKK